MIRTFGTWEEATIYASYMRSEGYFSALLDECAAPLYGPAAIGGIRVLVSDGPVTNDADIPDENSLEWETPPSSHSDGELRFFLRISAVSIVAFGLLILSFALLQAASDLPGGPIGILVHLLEYPALMGLVFLSFIPGLGFFTNAVRESQKHGPEGWLFWFVIIIFFSQILF